MDPIDTAMAKIDRHMRIFKKGKDERYLIGLYCISHFERKHKLFENIYVNDKVLRMYRCSPDNKYNRKFGLVRNVQIINLLIKNLRNERKELKEYCQYNYKLCKFLEILLIRDYYNYGISMGLLSKEFNISIKKILYYIKLTAKI
jgi:hypothetical protein